jgi:hypothetical protein
VSPPCCCWPTASSAAPAWQGSTPDPLAIIPSTPGALLLKGALFHLHLALPSPSSASIHPKIPHKKSGRLLCRFCPARLAVTC